VLCGNLKAQIEFDINNNPENLKWLHAAVSNAKAFISGAFHGLGDKYFQRCLNEFGTVPTTLFDLFTSQKEHKILAEKFKIEENICLTCKTYQSILIILR
jgi:hypothetical protein